MRGRPGLALLAVLLLSPLACASVQQVSLDVQPRGVALYVDGELLSPLPAQLELRSDRDHKLYFKRAGYRAELVVLQSRDRDGARLLEPGQVRVRLVSLMPARPELVIERDTAPGEL